LRRQACAHCEQFPTAASRRSLGRVSVPVWPSALSGRLPIEALVGHYPTNKLIGRRSLFKCQVLRSPALISTDPKVGYYAVLALLSEGCPPLEGRSPTRYSPVCHSTRSPKAANSVRLACVRHAASVDSEPGSNSQVKALCLGTPSRISVGQLQHESHNQ
jgi:hypothetical protein